ncbi:MAG: DUF1330 domain-containing protein [Candidatus Cloacimonetes bacterium]|nr:DUF1330 domain-containing protein [Candidatus Cloacimonadota bacterium]
MSIENLVGLSVVDNVMYQQYREKMLPLLKEYGGGFGYDFKVSEVLKSEDGNHNINRVFTIYFKDEQSMKSFFSNPLYLDIRKKYFDSSVQSSTIIARYEK